MILMSKINSTVSMPASATSKPAAVPGGAKKMTTDWFAVYQESDGTLLSVATVVPRLRAGLASKPITGPPAREIWNPTTLVFDPTPPPPPDVDRVTEFLDALPNGFSNRNRTDLRSELAKLLGPLRFRDAAEERDLRD